MPKGIFLLHEFLSRDKCAALIRASEGLTYETGTVDGVVAESIRNNERVLVTVKPMNGAALVFLHAIWHEGAVVESREKYVLRIDVMYKL